jgi:hypothetical protein
MLNDDDEVIERAEVTDVELSTYLSSEQRYLKKLGIEINVLIDKVNHLKSEYNFRSASMWHKAFEIMPEVHPAKHEKVDKLEYEPDTSTILLVKTGRK